MRRGEVTNWPQFTTVYMSYPRVRSRLRVNKAAEYTVDICWRDPISGFVLGACRRCIDGRCGDQVSDIEEVNVCHQPRLICGQNTDLQLLNEDNENAAKSCFCLMGAQNSNRDTNFQFDLDPKVRRSFWVCHRDLNSDCRNSTSSELNIDVPNSELLHMSLSAPSDFNHNKPLGTLRASSFDFEIQCSQQFVEVKEARSRKRNPNPGAIAGRDD